MESFLVRRRQRAHQIVTPRVAEGLSHSAVWGPVGLAMTAAAAVSVAVGFLWPAIILLTIRIGLSLWLGPGDENLPLEGAPPRGPELVVVARCLVSHIGDVLILLAAGWTLTEHARPAWGWALAAVIAVTLLGTVTRLAALQVGLPLRRLQMERLFRNGGIFVGLLLAAILQPKVTVESLPVLALVGVGPALYAAIELIRSASWLRWLASSRPGIPAQAPLIVDQRGGVHRAGTDIDLSRAAS
jgi:hypothetical protein